MIPKALKLIRWLCFINLASYSLTSLAVEIDDVRMWRAPEHTRLVFDLSEPLSTRHKMFTLANPNRVVIDIPQSDLKKNFTHLNLSKTPIKKIRTGRRPNGDLRVVLDLKQKVKPESFTLAKRASRQDRLVIDLQDLLKSKNKKITPKAEPKRGRDIIIAIDAGHGGEDPGAIGPMRVYEKDVVLAIAKDLKHFIDLEPGFKATLIRKSDYYVPLKKRRDSARNSKADFMVSIHADSFSDSRVYGASVFALSENGASSEGARFLANKENESDLNGGAGNIELSKRDDDVANTLLQFSQKATLDESIAIGDFILRRMKHVTKLHKKKVEQAAFAVLKSPDVPSLLVETGFISNPSEARKLSTRRFRNNMARAIFNGVKDYYYAHPPQNSYLALNKDQLKNREYVIAYGDTLSEIAMRHKISLSRIKKINRLQSTSIHVGQKLIIPAS